MSFRASIARGTPWELRGRGLKDSLRHDERVKRALKEHLKDLILQEDILINDGARQIRIPMRSLEQYRFKNGVPLEGVGQGPGKPGDLLWYPGQPMPEGEPGDQPGEHTYDVDVDVATLTQMMLDDFALPWLEAKPNVRAIATEDIEWTDRRKRGMPGNLDKRQMLKENSKRNAARRQPGIHDLHPDDMRYRAWRARMEDVTSAAVYLCMDWSGSMTTEKKYLAKAMSFWIVQFLRLKYRQIDIVFLAHDTRAEVVSEHDFFARSEGGGTVCSTVYTVALQEIAAHHPRAQWNIYLCHFSDGENEASDNSVCLERIRALLQECTMVAYTEIAWATTPVLLQNLLQVLQQIQHPRFFTTVLRTRADIHEALRTFLGAEIGAQA